MSSYKYFSKEFISRLTRKPLSLATTILALGAILYSVYLRAIGNIYIERLNYVDVTTLILVAILLLRAVTKLADRSDLQTFSIALISVLSFIFSYEAIYKWSFYFLPWRMPPEELREFVIQVAISLVILAGFAEGKYRFSRASKITAIAFVLFWTFWLLVGFPQLWDDKNIYPAILNIPFTHGMIYTLNRVTKIMLFLGYYFLYR
ncbi:MAG: hypothetical protein MUO76_23490 [Anaerolineaceae bacterium]|nr:hypothetical protein [Anaerolineaceae bacterium]